MDKVKWLNSYCHQCGKQLNSWDMRCSKVLAYKNAVCEECMAKEYDMDIMDLRSRFEHVFGMRPCLGL